MKGWRCGYANLIVLDTDSAVIKVWRGQLSSTQEIQVFDSIAFKHGPDQGGTETAAAPTPAMSGTFDDSLVKGSGVVVDVRSHQEFALSHIHHALNIPYDEIAARSEHELPHDRPLLIYCYRPDGGASSFCSFTGQLLRKQGFQQLRYIDADLEQLGKRGVAVVKGEP